MWFPKKMLVLAGVLGAVVAVVAFFYLGALSSTEKVVVANRDIPPFARITADMVRVVDHPLAAIHSHSLADVEQAVGRYVEHPVSEGRPLLTLELVEAGDARGEIPWQLEGTHRAMAVPARPSKAVGGSLRPGHRVDVIHYRDPSVHGSARSARMLTFVPVLDVRTGTGASWDPGGPETPTDVLLSVTVAEAERLAYALATGTLYLVASPYHPAPEAAGVPGGVGGDDVFRISAREAGDPHG